MNVNPEGAVAQIFLSYAPEIRGPLLELRRLILNVANETPGVGRIEEALRWNQPSYLTTESKSGSTLRMDAVRSHPGRYALYFHCQTTLISSFRKKYGRRLTYEGNRALIFNVAEPLPTKIVKECVREALTYHVRRSGPAVPIGSRIK